MAKLRSVRAGANRNGLQAALTTILILVQSGPFDKIGQILTISKNCQILSNPILTKFDNLHKKEKGPPAGFEPDRNELNANRRPARTPLGHGRIIQRRVKVSPIPRITFRFPAFFKSLFCVFFGRLDFV